MARVPTYNGRQVAPDALPNVRITDRPAQDMRAGAQAIAQGVGAMAGVGAQWAMQEQEKFNDSQVMLAEQRYLGMESKLFNDPETGAFAQQGANAMDLTGRYLPQWDKESSAILDGLPRHLRDRVRRYAVQRRGQAEQGLMRHQVKQMDSYYETNEKASIAAFENEALTYRDDPARVDQAAMGAMAVYESRNRRLGIVGEANTLSMRAGYSGVQRKAIEALSHSDPIGAEQRLSQVRGDMLGEDALALDNVLRPSVDDKKYRAELQDLMDGVAPPVTHYTGPETQYKASAQLDSMSVQERKRLSYNAPALNGYAAHIEQKYGLPVGLINALKNAGEKSNSWQTSSAGARGVMQFMPDNIKKYGVTDPEDPAQMIDAAGKYLRDTMRQYGGNLDAVIADYNGGPKQANPVKAGGQPAAKETREYLARVKAALGGQREVGGINAAPPQSEAETLRLIDERYANNPVKREAMRRLAQREWNMRDMEKREQDNAFSESIYQKIYAASPGQSLAQLATPPEKAWLEKTGQWDTYESELDRRLNKPDYRTPAHVSLALEEILYKAAMGDETAMRWLRETNPYGKEHANLDQGDRKRLAGAKVQFTAGDRASQEKAMADWTTEQARLDGAMADLGIAAVPGQSKQAKNANKKTESQRAAFNYQYRLALQSLIQQNGGKKPRPDILDALVREVKLRFHDGRVTYDQASKLQQFSSGLPLDGVQLSQQDRATVVAVLRSRGTKNPTEAQVLAVASAYKSNQR